jgi:hypothetical protein
MREGSRTKPSSRIDHANDATDRDSELNKVFHEIASHQWLNEIGKRYRENFLPLFMHKLFNKSTVESFCFVTIDVSELELYETINHNRSLTMHDDAESSGDRWSSSQLVAKTRRANFVASYESRAIDRAADSVAE